MGKLTRLSGFEKPQRWLSVGSAVRRGVIPSESRTSTKAKRETISSDRSKGLAREEKGTNESSNQRWKGQRS
jgi:hypothetical protein